jgi:hypothetical protein
MLASGSQCGRSAQHYWIMDAKRGSYRLQNDKRTDDAAFSDDTSAHNACGPPPPLSYSASSVEILNSISMLNELAGRPN